MPRKRDKRKLDTQIKRAKLRKAEAELKVYKRTHEVPDDYVETDPEILRLEAAKAQVNLCYRRQLHYNSLCQNLLWVKQDAVRGQGLAAQVLEEYPGLLMPTLTLDCAGDLDVLREGREGKKSVAREKEAEE